MTVAKAISFLFTISFQVRKNMVFELKVVVVRMDFL